jgi:hypothetical protein
MDDKESPITHQSPSERIEDDDGYEVPLTRNRVQATSTVDKDYDNFA